MTDLVPAHRALLEVPRVSHEGGSARQRPITVATLLRTWRSLERLIETLPPDDGRLSIVCDHAREVRQAYQAVTSPGATADRFILARAVTTRADAVLRWCRVPRLTDR